MRPFQLGRKYRQGVGRVWRGRAGQCARPSPQTLPLTCLHSLVHVLSAATFLLWRELRLCGQDGKPKAYVAPGSSLEEGDEQ